jgi:hypothetical protein
MSWLRRGPGDHIRRRTTGAPAELGDLASQCKQTGEQLLGILSEQRRVALAALDVGAQRRA